MTFDALDNVLSGYDTGCNVPSVGAPLASCYSQITGLYLDVFRKCYEFCGVKLQREYNLTFRGSLAFVRGVGDGLDKQKLQPSLSSVCGPPASLPGRSFHANPNALMTTSQLGRVSNNGCFTSRRVRNVQVRPRLNLVVGMQSTSRRTNRRVLTSGGTVDSNFVAVQIDESINVGQGPYVFKVFDQIYHWIGSLCPPAEESPRFLQLYIYDTDNDVQNRMHHFRGIDNNQLEPGIVDGLINFLDAHNELVQLFRTARDKSRELDVLEFKIRLYNAEGARGYELPTSNTLGAMVFENGISDNAEFDCIIQHRDSPPQRVNKLHPSYMSLQFPLLFIYGQPGYHTELTLKSDDDVGRGKRVTMLACYRYQLYFRLQQYDLLFRGGRLFQHYVVGLLCDVKQNRLDYIRKNKMIFDYLLGLYDAISQGEQDGYEVGGGIILPMSFTGSPRYMFMSEYPHLTASDIADVVCHVFEQNIQALIHFLKEERIFGDVTGVLYTVEFQKRGLPYRHTLLWVDSAIRIRIAEDVDPFILAELPDLRIDPEGYNVVLELMMHGPCGAVSLKSPYMKGDKCSKKFPKKFNQKTFFDENGHVHYQRRDTSVSATRNEFQLDNSYVVSYNRHLLLSFRAHINVEYCGCSRFICAHEAHCRILKFDIHRREPAVQILVVHLEDMQRITFRDQDKLESVIDLPGKKSTMLTEWFDFNEANEVGKNLSYLEFPSEFVWYSDRKSRSPRKNRKSSIGRLTPACQALCLFGDDKGWEITFQEACGFATPEELRKDILEVASSVIASLLLPSGRTAHSRFKLPLELTEESLCRFTKNNQLGKLLADTDLIIWDDRRCFEALGRRLRDIVDKPSSLFGGKSVLFGGDFLQTLLVKKGASKIEVISSCISKYALWPSFKVFTLKHNMRLVRPDISLEERSLVNSFASWLLDVGDGKIGEPANEDPKNTSWVHIPPAYCLPPDEEGLSKLIDFIDDQNIINSKVLAMVPGESTIYIRQDKATPTGNDGAETEMLYPIEHLNTFNLPGFPPHLLELKVGALVMLLRNVNTAGGLCNGTRMIVRQLMTKLIEVHIITRTRVREKVFIYRIPLIHNDPNLPFVLN
nr:DNA helicase [Tanacetum cinerariifolium]